MTFRDDEDIVHFRDRCPLTHLGIYGLTSKHKLRLCSSQKNFPDLYLLKHFHRYHHLTPAYSLTLTKALINKLDPLTTCIFQSKIDFFDKHYHPITCPLNKMKIFKIFIKKTFITSSSFTINND